MRIAMKQQVKQNLKPNLKIKLKLTPAKVTTNLLIKAYGELRNLKTSKEIQLS